MKHIKENIFIVLFTCLLLIAACSDDSNDDSSPGPNPPPQNTGNVTITSIGSGDLFWGDEMTINGTGFSAVKEENIIKFTDVEPVTTAGGCSLKYTSAGGDIEIISASATQIKIKVPVKLSSLSTPLCGPRKANLDVTVGGKTATHNGIEFGPLPYIGQFAYHYGWFDAPKVTRIGDSVMLHGGLIATPPKTSKYWDKVRLSIDGADIQIKHRSIGSEAGWSFYLPVKEYAIMNCSEEPDGWGAREMEFKFYIEGTNKSASRKLFVQYLPTMTAACDNCSSPLSKLAGGNPEWVVKGTNMNFSEVRFSPILPCSGLSQAMGIVNVPWTDEIRFTVPLSILTENCSYGVFLTNACDTTKIGQIGISP